MSEDPHMQQKSALEREKEGEDVAKEEVDKEKAAKEKEIQEKKTK